MVEFLPLLLAAALTKDPEPEDAQTTSTSSNVLDNATGFAVPAPVGEDPAEGAYLNLLALDDRAREEVDQWIREADSKGAETDGQALQRRINEKIEMVDQAYRKFLGKHPAHVRARIAFGSFMNDPGREMEER